MIIETVTLSTTPQSVYALVVAARTSLFEKTDRCTGMIIRNDSGNDVFGSDKGTVTPVLLTDGLQPFESHMDSNLHQTFLHSDVDATEVGLVISQ